MPINRTYQGRVTGSYWTTGKKNEREYALSDENLEQKLQTHLSIYHCAINYYLVCFAALAKGSKVEALMNLHKRVSEAWDQHIYRRGGKGEGFNALLHEYLPHVVSAKMSFEDACDALIERRGGDDEVLQLALEALLNDLGGESSIQQGGRSYLPYFCNAKTNANYPRSSLILQRNKAKLDLPSLLHHATRSDAQKMREDYSIYHFVNLNPAQPDKICDDVVALLNAFNKHLNSEGFLSAELFNKNQTDISSLCVDDLSMVSYMGASAKGAEKSRLYAFVLFKTLPFSMERFGVLKELYPEPKEGEADKKLSESKRKELEYEEHLQSLGEDPILKARGARKYVFQSFSSRFTRTVATETPEWIEFDISSFKEALKTLNQIEQKTEERLKEIEGIQSNINYFEDKKSKGSNASNPEEPVTFTGDSRLGDNLSLWDEFKIAATPKENEVFGTNKVTWRAIKGWRDVRPKFQKYLKENPKASKEDLIQQVWVAYQGKNKNIGNTELFHTLADPRFHDLWREVEESQLEEWRKKEWSHDLLSDLVKYDELKARVIELEENLDIKLTPAHIRNSRRPIMLSDLTGSSKVVYKEVENDKGVIDYSLVSSIYAQKEDSKEYKQHRIELCYSSPRQLRDGISGRENRTLLPPMVLGLDLKTPSLKEIAPKAKELAVALMPDFGRSEAGNQTRFLLNFPAQLNTEWIEKQLGKAERWQGQFVGTKDDHLYIQWPSTIKKGAKGWWQNPDIIKNGYTVFSVDLGLKSAAAYSTLKVVSEEGKVPKNKKSYMRLIGEDGERQWFAYPVARGTLRLPGEDAKVLRPEISKSSDKSLALRSELGGSTGRKATDYETEEFKKHIESLRGYLAPWLVEEALNSTPEHFAVQNDELLKAVKQAQGYLSNRHHIVGLVATGDLLVRKEKEPNARQKERLDEAFKIQEPARLEEAKREISSLQVELKDLVVVIANRVLPHRRYNWAIEKGSEEELTGVEGGKYHPYTLVRKKRSQEERVKDTNKTAKKIRGQRGLSAARIEQLENLRRRMSSLQRELNRAPGAEMTIGEGKFVGALKEPAPEILEKLDHLKEERVKQTAHLILAQALGLRLRTEKTVNREGYIHGEYEKIPNAEVADFIVMEDLNRYLTSQGRSKAENRQLMKWSHRAIAESLKELVEPYGLKVVTANASYSSRFCASTSRPGFRATTIIAKNLDHYALEKLRECKEGSDEKRLADQIDEAFSESANKHLQMLIPTDGGTMFIPIISDGEVRKRNESDPTAVIYPVSQADINAAINIGLRAIAAPGMLSIFHKLRVESGSKPRRGNNREKAAYTAKQEVLPTSGEFSKEVRGKKYTNFFHLGEHPLPISLDKGYISGMHEEVNIASGLGLWSHVKEMKFKQCISINESRS